jgi:hypothetical protein
MKAPSGAPTLPLGLSVASFFLLELPAGKYVGTVPVTVTLPAEDVPAPDKAIVLVEENNAWVPGEPVRFLSQGSGYTATVNLPCCGLATVAFDLQPPTLNVETPRGLVTGVVRVDTGARDNVAVARVDVYADGVLVRGLLGAPWELTFDSSKYGPGPLVIYVVAYDLVGNVASEEVVIMVGGVPSAAKARVADPVHSAKLFTWGPWIILVLLAILVVGFFILLLVRTRRSDDEEDHPPLLGEYRAVLFAAERPGLAHRLRGGWWRPLLSARVHLHRIPHSLEARLRVHAPRGEREDELRSATEARSGTGPQG